MTFLDLAARREQVGWLSLESRRWRYRSGTLLAYAVICSFVLLLVATAALAYVLTTELPTFEGVRTVIRIGLGVAIYPVLVYYVGVITKLALGIVHAKRNSMTIRTLIFLPFVFFRSADGTRVTCRWFDPPGTFQSGTVECVGNIAEVSPAMVKLQHTLRQTERIVGGAALLLLIGVSAFGLVALVSWFWRVYWISLPLIGFLLTLERSSLAPWSDIHRLAYQTHAIETIATISGERSLKRDLSMVLIRRLLRNGTRPADWPPEFVSNVIALPDDSAEDGLGNWYAHEYALDRGGYVAAGWYLERAVAIAEAGKLGLVQAAWVYRSAAYYAARYQRDPDAARRWLSKTMIVDHERQTDMRVEAAILEAEGRWDESRRLALEGLRYHAPSITPGFRHVDIDRLKELTLVPDWDSVRP